MNNPVRYVDPDGRDEYEWTCGLLGCAKHRVERDEYGIKKPTKGVHDRLVEWAGKRSSADPANVGKALGTLVLWAPAQLADLAMGIRRWPLIGDIAAAEKGTAIDGLGDVCDETPEPAGPVGRWPVSRLTAASPFSVWVRLHVAGRTFYLLVVAEGQKAKLFFLAKATQQRAGAPVSCDEFEPALRLRSARASARLGIPQRKGASSGETAQLGLRYFLRPLRPRRLRLPCLPARREPPGSPLWVSKTLSSMMVRVDDWAFQFNTACRSITRRVIRPGGKLS